VYSITAAGKAEVQGWFAAPVERANPPRNELAIKLALAVTLPGVNVQGVIQSQRVASIRALQDYTKSRRDTAATQRAADTAWLLVLDSLIFQTEAEVRWLDLCEARMVQQAQAQAQAAGQGANGQGSTRKSSNGAATEGAAPLTAETRR
jgi:hypothetical protein